MLSLRSQYREDLSTSSDAVCVVYSKLTAYRITIGEDMVLLEGAGIREEIDLEEIDFLPPVPEFISLYLIGKLESTGELP